MRIALDVNFPFETPAGLDIWTEGLIEGFSKINKENQFFIFGYFWRNFDERKEKLKLPESNYFTLFLKKFPKPIITFLEDNNIPIIERWLLKKNIDIYHSTGYFVPNLKKIKSIVTIHGLDFEEMDSYWYKDKWYKNVPLYLSRANKIIAVSQYVKNSIVKHYKIPEKKIKVIYPGLKNTFRLIEDKNELNLFREKYNIFFPYILTVITVAERKNLKGIFYSFSHIKDFYPELKLVIVGNTQEVQSPFLSTIEKLGIKEKVFFPGYISSNELVYFYNLAELFIFPSFYEGFGFPVVEAMACGCPVITSNLSSIPEITDDAAILVNPYKIEEIVDALKKILKDENLKIKLKQKGIQRAKLFTWEKCAQEMLKTYEELFSEPRPP